MDERRPSTDRNQLTAADYASAAEACGCDVAAIRAVDEIESRGSGFDSKGRPTILFERHWFRRLTKSRFDKTHPHLSHAYLPPRQNPSYKRDQWELMYGAMDLDPAAAVQSASWGRFQIMGFNYRAAGCDSLPTFVARMKESALQHLLMFVAFCKSKGLHRALAAHDWTAFAHGYNGADHAANNYVGKLSTAYARHAQRSAPATPDDALSLGAKVRQRINTGGGL